jgi:hypothetical protein
VIPTQISQVLPIELRPDINYYCSDNNYIEFGFNWTSPLQKNATDIFWGSNSLVKSGPAADFSITLDPS